MTNGEGGGPPIPPDSGEPTEDQLRAAEEWEGRQQKGVDADADRLRAKVEAEQAAHHQSVLDAEEAKRARLLKEIEEKDKALADAIERAHYQGALDEEAAHDNAKLKQLEKEQQSMQAMKWEEERRAQDERELIAERFSRPSEGPDG